MNNPSAQKIRYRNVDFRLLPVSNIEFRHAEIVYCRFDGLDLTNIDFSNSCLAICNFTNTNLTNTNMSGTDLTAATFAGSLLVNTNFTDAYLGLINFTGTILHNACLHAACLLSTNFKDSQIITSNISSAWLFKTDLPTILDGSNTLPVHQRLFEIEATLRDRLPQEELYTRIKQKHNHIPERKEVSVSIFIRDPDVVAYVRLRANFRCEMPENTVALCPNCHRHLHHAINREKDLASLVAQLQSKGIPVSPS